MATGGDTVFKIEGADLEFETIHALVGHYRSAPAAYPLMTRLVFPSSAPQRDGAQSIPTTVVEESAGVASGDFRVRSTIDL